MENYSKLTPFMIPFTAFTVGKFYLDQKGHVVYIAQYFENDGGDRYISDSGTPYDIDGQDLGGINHTDILFEIPDHLIVKVDTETSTEVKPGILGRMVNRIKQKPVTTACIVVGVPVAGVGVYYGAHRFIK